MVVFLYYSVLQSTTPVLQSTTPVLQSTTPVLQSTTPILQSIAPVLFRTTKYYSVLQSTTPLLLRTTKYYSSTTPYYKILLRTTKYYSSTTKYYSSTTKYYSVLQNTSPVLQSTTPKLQSTTPYYKVLHQDYSVLQSTTPVLLRTTKYYSSTTPYYKVLFQIHRTSFQNERFARCFRQFSQKRFPKRAFRARLPPNFTERASKTSVSRNASDNFHRKDFQNEHFVRGFLQISQNELPKRAFRAMLPTIFTEKISKTSISCEASSKFHRTSFQNERFARCFSQFSPKMCVSLQFRAIDTPNPTRGFIRQNQNVRLATTACHPKFQNVRFAAAACAKMYESIDREPTRFAHTKM